MERWSLRGQFRRHRGCVFEREPVIEDVEARRDNITVIDDAGTHLELIEGAINT